MLGARDALGGGVAAEDWAFPEAGRPLLARGFCCDAFVGKRLLLAAMQILAAGGIFIATFRVGEALSAIENFCFAMADVRERSDASLESEMLPYCMRIQSWCLQETRKLAAGPEGALGRWSPAQEGS